MKLNKFCIIDKLNKLCYNYVKLTITSKYGFIINILFRLFLNNFTNNKFNKLRVIIYIFDVFV